MYKLVDLSDLALVYERRGRQGHRLARAVLTLAATLLSCTSEPSRSPADRQDAAASTPQPVDAGRVDATTSPRNVPLDAALSALDARVPSTTDASAGRASLIDHALWRPLLAIEDPFDDRPADSRCEKSGAMAELLADEPVFSVDTGVCSYLTVSQASQRAVAVGEKIKVRLWHFALNAPAPAQAHAAVLVDGLTVLDERVTIPAAGGLLSRELTVGRAIERGALVHFHLHNHGANSWALVELSTGD